MDPQEASRLSMTMVAGPNIVPVPYRVQVGEGYFLTPDHYIIKTSGINPKDQSKAVAVLVTQIETFIKTRLHATLRKATKGQPGLTNTDNTAAIILRLAPLLPAEQSSDTLKNKRIEPGLLHWQGYRLRIKGQQLLLEAESVQGLFYGWQSLQQLLLQASLTGSRQIAAVDILDYPRYGFRALMLDPARHFLPVEDIKQYIRTMAFYKYNYLHLHLTDDQGWRVQIKAFPGLTRQGALVKTADGRTQPLYYTQDELKDLVAFAAKYYVQLIPEIDIPGHNTALLTVMPHLACFPRTFTLRTEPGVSKDILDASNPKVYAVYERIFKEVAGIFPCTYFHLGGDEAPLDTWEQSARCQTLIAQKGLKDARGLMAYFLKRNAAVVQKLGKTPLFWYELDVPGYPENSIAYFWRMGLSKQVIRKAAGQSKRLIGAPGEHAYFDYPMKASEHPYADWMPVTSLKDVYQFNPGYDFNDSISALVMGVEATVWGEYVPSLAIANLRTYPRALAMAEAGWSFMENRGWEAFKKRVQVQLGLLKILGVDFENPDLTL
ncbi:hexosaminidase [Arachidicoccus rhizosphaerae]|uniref:beta-N-acetylhexosaminidase n=1 Tax=Arachidicoccus rhizosphaerae TaxID=551991 RepID=A0A1H4C8S2_9BACT|nr:beta-N-acetylhexosaminidase [Arachidicoccus rhizosphaerae]SEA56811.1 hexosaminidase [Arachidicoccus rhizosphaerae]